MDLQNMLYEGLKKDEGTISEKIACFLFSYGNIPHSTTGVTSWSDVWLTVAFMIGLLNPSLESCLEHNQQKVMISMLMNSSLVFVSNFGQEAWVPGIISEVTGLVVHDWTHQ